MRISHLVLDGFSLSKKSRLQSGLFRIINETIIHISFRINIYINSSLNLIKIVKNANCNFLTI